MEREFLLGQMVRSTKDFLLMECDKVEVVSHLLTAIFSKESGALIKPTGLALNIPISQLTQVLLSLILFLH